MGNYVRPATPPPPTPSLPQGFNRIVDDPVFAVGGPVEKALETTFEEYHHLNTNFVYYNLLNECDEGTEYEYFNDGIRDNEFKKAFGHIIIYMKMWLLSQGLPLGYYGLVKMDTDRIVYTIRAGDFTIVDENFDYNMERSRFGLTERDRLIHPDGSEWMYNVYNDDVYSKIIYI